MTIQEFDQLLLMRDITEETITTEIFGSNGIFLKLYIELDEKISLYKIETVVW